MQTRPIKRLRMVADKNIPFLEGVLEGVARVDYLPGAQIGPGHLRDADALIVRTRTRCDERLLAGSKVRCIASATIGFDHIDTAWCAANGIYWTNAPGCNAGSVQQYVASALACILERTHKPFRSLCLGIVGAGHTGARVQAMARQLGIRTLVHDPPRQRQEGPGEFVGLEDLLAEADVVSLHVPLNVTEPDKTLHMAGDGFCSRMKQGAWLINTSRGEVADTGALVKALRSGRLGGAIIDVWEKEPRISMELLQLADIATPHIAGYSADGKANGTARSVQALSRYFSLHLDTWRPTDIPQPTDPVVDIRQSFDGAEELFIYLAGLTYDIRADSARLKQDPDSFEKQREDYPLRREPGAYTLLGKELRQEQLQVVRALGFNSHL